MSHPAAAAAVVVEEEDEFHPESKWQEPVPTNDGDAVADNGGYYGLLTLYDKQRRPRHVDMDVDVDSDANTHHRRTTRLPLKVLRPDFRCPICMCYMKHTSIVMACLHRFCEGCIEDSIRLGKNECPTCRIHIPSRRSLRRDVRFDNLIQCIVGTNEAERQDEEYEQRHIIQLLKKQKNRGTLQQQNIRRQCNYLQTQQQQQTHNSKKRNTTSNQAEPEVKRTKQETSIMTTTGSRSPSSSISIQGLLESQSLLLFVEFLLLRYPNESNLDFVLKKDCIRMSGDAPVSVVQTFLRRKLVVVHGGGMSSDGRHRLPLPTAELRDNDNNNIQILIRTTTIANEEGNSNGGNSYVVLTPNVLLKDVRRQYFSSVDNDETMILYYSTEVNTTTTTTKNSQKGMIVTCV